MGQNPYLDPQPYEGVPSGAWHCGVLQLLAKWGSAHMALSILEGTRLGVGSKEETKKGKPLIWGGPPSTQI